MPKLLEIVELGNPVLRKKTVRLSKTEIKSARIQKLIDDMFYTLKDVNGAGLAAPQVSEALQLVIISPFGQGPAEGLMPPTELINPEIIWKSEEMIPGWEACLSIPGFKGIVHRHKELKIKFNTRTGKEKTMELSDFTARVFQHEFDHLGGFVYMDRLDIKNELFTMNAYEQLVDEEDEEVAD
jgi:peptide deformylase